MLYVPPVPAAGAPLRTPVVELKDTPLGSVPVSLNVGVGEPVAFTVNDPRAPTTKVVLFMLVIAGGTAAATLKLVLVVVRFSPVMLGFKASEAVSVSLLVAPVKIRLLKAACPLLVEVVAVAGLVVRSELASVTLTLAEPPVRALPLSVTVTAGAGDIAVPAMVPIEGGSVVKLTA